MAPEPPTRDQNANPVLTPAEHSVAADAETNEVHVAMEPRSLDPFCTSNGCISVYAARHDDPSERQQAGR